MSTLSVRWRDGGMEAKCPLCWEYLATTDEYWNPRSGLTRCRACWAEYFRLRQAHYTEEEAVRACHRMKNRLRYAAVREERCAANAAYRAANPERIRSYNLAYRAAEKGDPGPMEAYHREWPDKRLGRSGPPVLVAERRRQWRESKRRTRVAA